MTTILDGKRVDLGALRFGIIDEAGVAWRVGSDGLQGWDSAEVRSTITQREAAHGAWMGPTYLGERVITLAGTIVAPTGDLLDAAVETLLAAVSLDAYTVLTVYDAVPKQVSVRQSGKPIIVPITDTVATWSLLVTAPDPRRYGTVLQAETAYLPVTTGGLTVPATVPLFVDATAVSGAIIARNEGTIGSRPLLTIAGPVSSPTITVLYPASAATTLTYGDALLSGDVLVLDTDAHTATLNGTASRRRYVSGPWPEIPPASTVRLEFRAAFYHSTATLTASWRSAWK